MGFYYLGLTDEIGDPVTVGPREPRDCARALELLAPIAKVGEWGGFRQDFAEGYVRGLPANRRLRGSVRGAGQQVDDANVLRELVQGSELGYRDATLNLAYVLTSATEQSFYGYLIDAFADQETKKGLLGTGVYPITPIGLLGRWTGSWFKQQHKFVRALARTPVACLSCSCS